MRVLICGGRDYENREEFFDKVRQACGDGWREVEIISGMAKGADSLAVDYAEVYKLKLHKFWANWDKYGKSAGPRRNKQMLDEGKPDLVIAFPTKNSRGTWHMIQIAREYGVKVEVFEQKEV